jgi:phenylpropionate dioxygenase-like ring-hydroxylating dioxygenase large terminal subunit
MDRLSKLNIYHLTTICCAAHMQVAQGLLWVWPDASSASLAAASPPALSSQYGAEGWTLLGGEWFARDLEYGYDTSMENL